ncbi:hypothetical protein HMPREF2726_08680 [Neisseria sp. HMSC074B07]|nr:hypothetical protein HMPREF2726_08680 [Neisseria sp. HMSC074B07]
MRGRLKQRADKEYGFYSGLTLNQYGVASPWLKETFSKVLKHQVNRFLYCLYCVCGFVALS